MVGTRITTILADAGYTFENLSLETGVDITDRAAVDTYVRDTDASWIFHFAAVTDVDGAQNEAQKGRESVAWKVNVEATRYLVDACAEHHKSMVYISTDFVFDGTKDMYTEEDTPNPVGWYGKTKYEGEKLVMTLPQWIVARIAFPYGPAPQPKPDFVHKIRDRLAAGQSVQSPSDQTITPTYIDDIAHALDQLITQDESGIFHIVGDTPLTPHDAAVTIAETFGYESGVISRTTFDAYYKGKAPRPFHGALSNAKIKSRGIPMSSFADGLKKLKSQEAQ